MLEDDIISEVGWAWTRRFARSKKFKVCEGSEKRWSASDVAEAELLRGGRLSMKTAENKAEEGTRRQQMDDAS